MNQCEALWEIYLEKLNAVEKSIDSADPADWEKLVIEMNDAYEAYDKECP